MAVKKNSQKCIPYDGGTTGGSAGYPQVSECVFCAYLVVFSTGTEVKVVIGA